MKIGDFCERFNVQQCNLYTLRTRGKIPRNIFYRKTNEKVNRIKADYFIRRADFLKKVKAFNQEVYYYLEEFYTDTEIATAIAKKYNLNMHSLRVYLSFSLFQYKKPRPKGGVRVQRFHRLNSG